MTTSEVDRRVGSRVRQALAARPISKAVLDTSLHRSEGWISGRLRGETGFTLAELFAIVMVLDVQLDFFTGRLADAQAAAPGRDEEPAHDDVTILVERLDTIIRYGIPAIPDIVVSAEDLVDSAPPEGNESAAEELRCIAEDLLGLASTRPDVAGRLSRLADAMEKT